MNVSRAPLHGVLVVAVEHAVAAPLATRHLADLGARVIKIERPGGGDFARSYDTKVRGMSSHFVWLNRGKESVVLDVKDADHRAVLERLLDEADVFVENLAPRTAERLELAPDLVRRERHRLIACSISGYGEGGPYRDEKAYDLLIQSEAGVTALTGTPEAPAKVGIPVADIGAGMYAFSAILAALYTRERTGEGASLGVSLFDALAEWMSYPAYYTRYGGQAPVRAGLSHAAIAPYGPFRARGGEEIVLAVQNDPEWRALCREVLEEPQTADDPRFVTNDDRVANRVAVDELLGESFARLTVDELLERLARARIAVGRLRTVEGFLEHPAIVERDRMTSVDSPVGEIQAVLPPIDWVGQDPQMRDVPALGAHTDAVLAEFAADHPRAHAGVGDR
ncbi:MAG: CoA transferase [Solirubrobacterales bacterium]|nr:CoA transferase [Solirubrobacterales bacterium]